MSEDPWGPVLHETSPEEYARVMAVFDEIERGYKRQAAARKGAATRKRKAREAQDRQS